MKKSMSKILLISAIALASVSSMASELNTMCSVLNQILPGKAIVTSGLIKYPKYTMTKRAQIIANQDGSLLLQTKDSSSVFKMSNVGAGESSSCLLTFDTGLKALLVDMDLDTRTFSFVDEAGGIKLIIKK